MINIFNESSKLPEMSEFASKYYQLVLFNFMLMIVCYLLLPGQLYEKTVGFGIFFIFLIIATRIELMKSLIIKRIDLYFEKKSAMSKHRENKEGFSLIKKTTYNSFKKKEKILKIIIVVSIILLFKFITSVPRDKFYLMWIYSFTALSVVLFYSSNNMYKYFYELIGSLFENINFKNYYSSHSVKGDQIFIVIQKLVQRLKLIQLVTIISVVIISLILIYLNALLWMIYLPVFFILAIGIIVVDLNKLVIKILPILKQYDSSIKDKI